MSERNAKLAAFVKAIQSDLESRTSREKDCFLREELLDVYYTTLLTQDASFSDIIGEAFARGFLRPDASGEENGIILTEQGMSFGENPFSRSGESQGIESAISVDSTAWTGSRPIYLDSVKWRQVKASAGDLQELSRKVNFKTDQDRLDIQCMADAVVSLCEMAEPEIGIIERILAHPKWTIYASLFVAVATIRGAIGI